MNASDTVRNVLEALHFLMSNNPVAGSFQHFPSLEIINPENEEMCSRKTMKMKKKHEQNHENEKKT